ncbi:MAG TPA: trigger factor [Vicinamibacterales bacterium]|nr:trigger factor [Vicinamibacterales bacterium]
MKTEFVDVSETRKDLRVEIPSDVVDAEIERIAVQYSRRAKLPGFRPGKVPAGLIKQRFRDQILHDVAHDLIPRAVEDALRERGVEPVDTPDIRDVEVREGQPLTFTAAFDTLPALDPGDLNVLSLHRPPATVDDAAVEQALEQLRQRAARYEPVEGRPVAAGDTVVLNLDRRMGDAAHTDHHDNVSVELGAQANPPGLDDQLLGLETGATKTFTLRYPDDYGIQELAGKEAEYTVEVVAIKQQIVPALDDELAKDLGEFDTLEALRARVRADLEREAGAQADRELRADLLKQLAGRLGFEVPKALADREIERRAEEFARRLFEQGIDPRKTQIDWEAFREGQRDAARETVAGMLLLDEIAQREALAVTDAEVEAEIARYAEAAGRTPAAMRAAIEKEGGISSLYKGLQREKAIDFALARATIVRE